MGFLNTNSMPRLVEKLSDGDNIKITGNSKGNRVGTVIKKIVEKADDVTKAVEQEVVNEGYSFKVGVGDVDVSADIQDGFGEVGIKGVTYQNILGARINPSDGVEKNNNTITFNKVAQTNCTVGFPDSLAQVDKTYTLIFDILENTIENPANGNVGKINIVSYNSGNYFIKYKETGHKKILLKQPATSTGKPYVEFYNSTSGKFVMTAPILLEGDHTNNPNLPSYFEGIVGVGDKSKNLFNPSKHLLRNIFVDAYDDYAIKSARDCYVIKIEVKPNTQYCVTNPYNRKVIRFEDANGLYLGGCVDSLQPFTTPNNCRYAYCYVANEQIANFDVGAIQIEENSIATPYEPYYDGHKIEILSHGKNLWDLKNKSFKGFIEGGYGNLSSPDCQNRTSDFIRIKPNTVYTYMTTVDVSSSSHPVSWNAVAWYDENKNYITRSVKTGNSMGVDTIIFTLHSPSNAKYVRVGSRYLESEFSKATLSEGVISEHIPYVEDKTQILLDEPLMRLPDGTADEITLDGKLIRRVGKVILDGSENWSIDGFIAEKEKQITYKCNLSNLKEPTPSKYLNLICDKFPVTRTVIELDIEGISSYAMSFGSVLRLSIHKSKLSSSSLSHFKQWLQSNPTTVYYELTEPVVTDIVPPSLRIFKDGHLTFNTLVAPESSHLVQLNKSAQIERSIREVQGLDSRVGQLESFYDDMMLETSHKLNLLTYDFEYTKESEDI